MLRVFPALPVALLLATAAPAQEAVSIQPGAPPVLQSLGGDRFRDAGSAPPSGHAFLLSWRGVLPGSERVSLDGRPLRAFSDYDLDPESGILRLALSAAPSQVLQVSYRVVLAAARPNHVSALRPPTLRLPALPSARAGAGGKQILEEALVSSLDPARLAGPVVATGDGVSPPAREKRGLQAQLASGLKQTLVEQRIVDAGAGGTVRYSRSDAVDPQSAADAREELKSRLTLRPGPSSRLILENDFVRESVFTESYEEYERRKLEFEQNWDRSLAALTWERTRLSGARVDDARDALSLVLNHAFSESLSVESLLSREYSLYRGHEALDLITLDKRLASWLQGSASVQHRTSAFSGSTLDTGISLTAQPSSRFEASVKARQTDSGRYGPASLLFGEFTATPSDRLQLTGELSRRESQQFGELFNFGLGVAARPTARTLLEAALYESLDERRGQERSHTLRLSLDPSDSVSVRLGYDLLTARGEVEAQDSVWLVKFGRRRFLTLEGQSSFRVDEEDEYLDERYRLELRPVRELSLVGSLRRVEAGEQETGLGAVGATLRLFNVFDVSADYRRPTLETEEAELAGHDLRLGLSPFRSLRVFGQYSVRPENRRGELLDEVHRSLGVEARFGSLALHGLFTGIEGSDALNPADRFDLLASFRVGSGTRLYGGLRTLETPSLDRTQSRIYRLGISQAVNPRFFLMLEGQLGYSLGADGARTLDPGAARAQARIAARF